MHIITTSNHKGGCGKTTTAVNLSAGLALKGHPTLLIDLDPQGASTVGLGIDKSALSSQMTDVFLGKVSLAPVIATTGRPDLWLAPCSLNLAIAEAHLAGQPGREFVIREQLTKLASTCTDLPEYVVIDTPPNLGILTLNGLVAADTIVIPLQCEYYALEGVDQLEVMLGLIETRFGRNPSVRALLTMFNASTSQSKRVAEQAKTRFGSKHFTTKIPRNVKLSEAPEFGKSIFEHAPESSGAKAYADLVNEVIAS